jgi:ribosomal-protein-alanine N-acetyltransferase
MTAALPTLDGPRVRLRPVGPADAPDLFVVMGDPVAMRHWDGPPVPSLEVMAQRLDWMAAQDPERFGAFALVLLETGQTIGALFYHHREPRHRRLEVGYILGPAHWGRGLAFEAAQVLLGHCFDGLNSNRIEATVDLTNTASIRLLERLGFRCEGGPMREKILYAPDDPRDGLMYALLARDR